MTPLPQGPRQPSAQASPLRPCDSKAAALIESEIVIVDDDGSEATFDPASWFE